MKRQKLSKYDDKYVMLTDSEGLVFTGSCIFNSAEYCQCEFGRDEDALQIDDWLFYERDIIKIEEREPGEELWLSRPQHNMKIAPGPFYRIENGSKTVELRLYDEKRRRIRPGDIIRFEMTDCDEEYLRVEVLEISVFDSFAELYRTLPLTDCGYAPEELASASPSDMDRYYTPEEQALYGVVGIKIKLI